MDSTTLATSAAAIPEPDLPTMHSLYQALQALPTPRRKQGRRYELALILCLLILVKLAGQQTLSAATEWIRHRGVLWFASPPYALSDDLLQGAGVHFGFLDPMGSAKPL